MNTADSSGVLGRLAYAINNGLTVGTNLSYDSALKSRFPADIKWRFNTNGGPGKEAPKTNAAVSALTSTPSNRDARVHDGGSLDPDVDCSETNNPSVHRNYDNHAYCQLIDYINSQ